MPAWTIAGCSVQASENAAPKVEELVDGSEDRAVTPDIIAEINDSVTRLEPFANQIVQADEAPHFAVNDGDCPDPTGGPQPGKPSVRPRFSCAQLRRGPHHP
jgi:hypothetical protein